jgi:large subunit ribosomal protein L23
MNTYDVIIRPLVTEKSMKDVGEGIYTFAVAKSATKMQIKRALKDAFNVNVSSISTSIMKGKKKKVGVRRREVTDTILKKAIIMLKKGERIALFEPETDEKKKK